MFDRGALLLFLLLSFFLEVPGAKAQLLCSELMNQVQFEDYKAFKNKFNAQLSIDLEAYKKIPQNQLQEKLLGDKSLKPGEALAVLEAHGSLHSENYKELIRLFEAHNLVKSVENVEAFAPQADNLRVLDSEQLELFKRTGLIHDSFDMDTRRWDRNSKLALTVGTQSKSIVRRELGTNVVRSYSWLKVGGAKPGEVNLDRIHIARNYKKNGEPFSLEMLIHDGHEWKAYYFEIEGTYWKLTDKIREKKADEVCMKCHLSMGVGPIPKGQISPRPFFMKDELSWLRNGFTDKNLIKRLLEY